VSEWDDRLKKSQVHSILQKLSTLVAEASGREGATVTQLESIHRLGTGASYVQNRISQVDADLVPHHVLNDLATKLKEVHGQAHNFVSDADEAHLAAAHRALDNALQLVQQIPTVQTSADVDGLKDSISEYRRSAGQHVRYLQQDVDQLRSKASEQQSAIEEVTGELRAQLEALKSESVEQIEAQNREISQQKARLDQAIQNFVQQSSDAREKHSAQVTDLVTGGREDLAKLLASGKDTIAETLSDLGDDARTTMAGLTEHAQAELDGLKEKQERAAEIVGIIARTGMAGGYQQVADEERGQANFWRWIAVAAMSAIVGLALWMVVSVAMDDASTTALLTKSFATLTLGILAGYAGREGGKHRRREQRNRRLQLELSSIDAYLETLPEAERNAIKGALADRLFGSPDPPESDGADSVRPASMMDLVKLLMAVGEK
jgi:uncharacterized phage infection (PIP) family protein YhgE